ncbi:hypothetical protein SprV_0100315500 [Sparganum proliferum]
MQQRSPMETESRRTLPIRVGGGNWMPVVDRSVSGEVFPVGRADLQTLQESLQSVFVAMDLTSLPAGTRFNIFIEEQSGLPLVFHAHEVAASAQLLLSHHGVDAEDSCPSQSPLHTAASAFVHFEYGAEMETVTARYGVLKTDEGSAGFGNPAGHFFVDLGGAVEGAAQAEVVTGNSEEIHDPLHALFGSCAEGAVVDDEKPMDGSSWYT